MSGIIEPYIVNTEIQPSINLSFSSRQFRIKRSTVSSITFKKMKSLAREFLVRNIKFMYTKFWREINVLFFYLDMILFNLLLAIIISNLLSYCKLIKLRISGVAKHGFYRQDLLPERNHRNSFLFF